MRTLSRLPSKSRDPIPLRATSACSPMTERSPVVSYSRTVLVGRWFVYDGQLLARARHFIRLPRGTQGMRSFERTEGDVYVGPKAFATTAVFRALVDGGVTNGLAGMLYRASVNFEESEETVGAVRGLLSTLRPQHLFSLFPDGCQVNPWHGCVVHGREQTCRTFLQLASEMIDSTDERGFTPLMSAIAYVSSTSAETHVIRQQRQRVLQMLLNMSLADEMTLASETQAGPSAAGGFGALDVLPSELLMLVLKFFIGPRGVARRATLRQLNHAGFAMARSTELGARLAADRRGKLGESALHLLMRLEDTRLALGAVKHLQRAGASLQALDGKGRSVLSHACAHGRPELVRDLLRRGASHSADEDGFTPLHDACASAPVLLDPPVRQCICEPYNPLAGSLSEASRWKTSGHCYSCERRWEVTMKDYDREENQRTYVRRRYAECARLLLANGADPLTKTKWGKLPDLALVGLAHMVAPTPPDQLATTSTAETSSHDTLPETPGPSSAEWQPPPPPPPERTGVERLTELGFDEQLAIQALARAKGDVDQAAALLLEG